MAKIDDLIAEFYSPLPSNRPAFSRITCGIFEAAANSYGNWTATQSFTKNGTPWTISFAEETDDLRVSLYVRESQNSTQIVNCYLRVSPILIVSAGTVYVESDLGLFKKDSMHFDFGSPHYAEIVPKLEEFLKEISDAAHEIFKITFFYEPTLLNSQRANVLREFMGKLGANSQNIKIEFIGGQGKNFIRIEPWF